MNSASQIAVRPGSGAGVGSRTGSRVLGISAFYHDSAAALVVDGEIVAAAQEERFTRKKHDAGYPANAVAYCLRESGLAPRDLDCVAFYEKPLTKFDRLVETYVAHAPRGLRSFRQAVPVWLREKVHVRSEIEKRLPGFDGEMLFPEHHESHAASAFFPSPFERAAVITVDGVGEWATTTIGVGRGNRLKLLKEIRFPHSLGLLYSAFTYYTGFKVNSGEYKVMGLAPYGRPVFKDLILEKIIRLRDDGSFWMDMKYFDYCVGLTMTNRAFAKLFGGPPRRPESEVTQREMDLAASVQAVVEEAMFRLVRHTKELTGEENLCLAGGVALNCVANGKILRQGTFKEIFVQPAAGDAGGALGAALVGWHHYLDRPRTVAPDGMDSQRGSLLGPSFTDAEIQAFAKRQGAVCHVSSDDADLCERTAALIAEGNVVGWVQGRMEFGPRALGCRSILADPRRADTQKRLNLKIKFRESFRPFAPIVLEERVGDYFDLDRASPYMLLVAPVRESRRIPLSKEDAGKFGLDLLNVPKSDVPAVTHVDYSARVQTVDGKRNPLLHRLLSTFEKRQGCGVLVNTSFNVRGEPIVCTPEDAYRCFMFTHMDVLVMGRQIFRKGDQPEMPGAKEYLAEFPLD
ncbi:MAG TPA: carbamoyltransferase [Planctomycetota bacterium]|nr:carbamoyltransferase [Planctomycetota bacterium]